MPSFSLGASLIGTAVPARNFYPLDTGPVAAGTGDPVELGNAYAQASTDADTAMGDIAAVSAAITTAIGTPNSANVAAINTAFNALKVDMTSAATSMTDLGTQVDAIVAGGLSDLTLTSNGNVSSRNALLSMLRSFEAQVKGMPDLDP